MQYRDSRLRDCDVALAVIVLVRGADSFTTAQAVQDGDTIAGAASPPVRPASSLRSRLYYSVLDLGDGLNMAAMRIVGQGSACAGVACWLVIFARAGGLGSGRREVSGA